MKLISTIVMLKWIYISQVHFVQQCLVLRFVKTFTTIY
eukprot:UN34365